MKIISFDIVNKPNETVNIGWGRSELYMYDVLSVYKVSHYYMWVILSSIKYKLQLNLFWFLYFSTQIVLFNTNLQLQDFFSRFREIIAYSFNDAGIDMI